MVDTNDETETDPPSDRESETNDEVLELTDEVPEDEEPKPGDGPTDRRPSSETPSVSDQTSDTTPSRDDTGAPSAAIVTRRDSDVTDATESETDTPSPGVEVDPDPDDGSESSDPAEEAFKTVQMQAIDRRAIERKGQVRQLDQTLPLLSARFAPEIVVSSPDRHVEHWQTEWTSSSETDSPARPGDDSDRDSSSSTDAPSDEAPRTRQTSDPDGSPTPQPPPDAIEASLDDDSETDSPSNESESGRKREPTPSRHRSRSPQAPPEAGSPPPQSEATGGPPSSSDDEDPSSGDERDEKPDASSSSTTSRNRTNSSPTETTDAKASKRSVSNPAHRSTPKGKPVQPASGEPSPSAPSTDSTPRTESPPTDDASDSETVDARAETPLPPEERTDDAPPDPGERVSTPALPESETDRGDDGDEDSWVDELPEESGGESDTSVSMAPGLAPPPESDERSAEWIEEVFSEMFLLTLPESIPRRTAEEADFIEASLEPDEDDRILDLACGFGRHALKLAQRGYQLVGFDLSKDLLEKALARAERQALQIKFFHGDMREMEFEGIFDSCFCWQTSFGYFDDRTNRDILARVNRSLRPGGEFLLDVVNRDYVLGDMPHRIWWEGMDCVFLEEGEFDYDSSVMHLNRSFIYEDGSRPPMEQDYEIRLYSLHELRQMLRSAGFRVDEVSGSLKYRGYFLGPDSPRLIVRATKERSIE